MAVFTPISEDEARTFLKKYETIPRLIALEPIAEGIENSNFCLHTAQEQKYILTLFEKRVRKDDVPYFANLLSYLYKQGMLVPKVMANNQGALFDELKGKLALISSFLAGVPAQIPQEKHLRQVGTFLADLHQHSQNFPHKRASSLTFHHWKELLAASYPTAHTIRTDLQALLKETVSKIEPDWPPYGEVAPKNLPTGICHNDLFIDNVFFDGTDKLSGVFDFYFSAHDYFIYDIAITLHAWCFPSPLAPDKKLMLHFLRSYHQKRPLTEKEWDVLPTMMIGAALRFISTRLYDWLHPPQVDTYTPKDPEEYILHLEWCLDHRSIWQDYRHLILTTTNKEGPK